MKNILKSVFLAGLMIALSGVCTGEELDLSALKAFDWSAKKHGAQVRSRILLAPTSDSVELVRLLKKKFGIRLTTEDATHAIVISSGAVKAHADLIIKRADIDRMRRLIEFEVELINIDAREIPKTEAEKEKEQVKVLVDAKADEFVIAEAKEEPKLKEAEEQEDEVKVAQTEKKRGSPTLLLPVGLLGAGTWWLQVETTYVTSDEKRVMVPFKQSFLIKDHRNYRAKGGKGHDTPVVGLQKPDSADALQGMGGQ